MKKKCYLYTRVSTAAQIEGYSLEAQTEKLREYAVYRELEIAGEYCDAGKSGKSIKGRPAFRQMLDDVVNEKDGISVVLVFKLSRFGRNAADVLKAMQLLTDYGVDLVCVEDAIDSSTQGGRLTMAILSAVAEIEKENITVQFLSGKMQKLGEGGWPGGPIPYGYRNINKKLVIEPGEAEIVKLIYNLYGQDGMMVNSVVNYLNGHGYKKTVRNEQRPFTFDMVKTILDNPVYCGKILYNRRTNDKAGNRKKKDMIAVDGNHEPLVTPKQWDLVRMKREKHKGRSKKAEDPERISLLSGLVKCPKCGSGMIAKKNKSINHNHGGYYKTLYYYGCNSNRKCNGRVYDRIEKAEDEMEGKMKRLSAAKQGIQAADRIAGLLERMEKLYGHMSCEERRKMYRLFIERIDVYPEHPDGKIIYSRDCCTFVPTKTRRLH